MCPRTIFDKPTPQSNGSPGLKRRNLRLVQPLGWLKSVWSSGSNLQIYVRSHHTGKWVHLIFVGHQVWAGITLGRLLGSGTLPQWFCSHHGHPSRLALEQVVPQVPTSVTDNTLMALQVEAPPWSSGHCCHLATATFHTEHLYCFFRNCYKLSKGTICFLTLIKYCNYP